MLEPSLECSRLLDNFALSCDEVFRGDSGLSINRYVLQAESIETRPKVAYLGHTYVTRIVFLRPKWMVVRLYRGQH